MPSCSFFDLFLMKRCQVEFWHVMETYSPSLGIGITLRLKNLSRHIINYNRYHSQSSYFSHWDDGHGSITKSSLKTAIITVETHNIGSSNFFICPLHSETFKSLVQHIFLLATPLLEAVRLFYSINYSYLRVCFNATFHFNLNNSKIHWRYLT